MAKKSLLSEQPLELVSNHTVTFANRCFEFLTVEDLNMTAHVTDRPGILQASGSHGHAFRRTPNMSAISSWVITNSSVFNRS